MRKILLVVFVSIFFFGKCFSQGGVWTWISGPKTTGAVAVYGTQGVPSVNNHPAGAYEATEWKDKNGNFWVYGGMNGSNTYSDLWKYNPKTNEWTWVKGNGTSNQIPVYGTKGVPNAANTPGSKIYASASWVDTAGNLWLFGGGITGVDFYNDLWKYDISSNNWTWISGSNIAKESGVYGTQSVPSTLNHPGGRCETASAWTDSSNNLWLFSGRGYDINGYLGFLCDLWKYNISTDEWTWMKGSQNINDTGSYGTKGVPASTNYPGGRMSYTKWVDKQDNFWIMGGYLQASSASDVWMYNPTTNNWTWMYGPNTLYDLGKYQSKCVTNGINMPISRSEQRASVTDNCGRFWMFGGAYSHSVFYYVNDLWVFDPSTSVLDWKWLSGTNIGSQAGNYGTKGVPAASNIPSSRWGSVAWWGNDNKFYMFGGSQNYTSTSYADLWVFNPDTNCILFSCAAFPKANFTSNDTAFCDESGKCLTFTDHSTNNPTSWKWLFPGATPNISNQQNPTGICYTTPGTYPVTLVVSNAAGSDSITVSPMITVGSTPAAPILTISNDTIYCSHAASYQWFNSKGIIVGATDSFYVFSPSVHETYTVYITDSIGCSRLSEGVVITGAEEFTVYGLQFTVYPNPVGEEGFTVYGLQFTVTATLTVYNVFGEKVFEKTTSRKQETVNCKHLSSGIYFLEVTGEKVFRTKFVKK